MEQAVQSGLDMLEIRQDFVPRSDRNSNLPENTVPMVKLDDGRITIRAERSKLGLLVASKSNSLLLTFGRQPSLGKAVVVSYVFRFVDNELNCVLLDV